jgi:predicted DNA-binding transcriptional regulator AlpA
VRPKWNADPPALAQLLDVVQASATRADGAAIEAPMSPREAERQRQRESAKKPALPLNLIKANIEHRAKAALADELPRHNHDREHVYGARAPPPLVERLLSKYEVMTITGLSYPTLWQWMRDGRFPRSRIVGGKSMWLSTEIDAWLAGLPVRPLKGDAPDEVA